MDKGNSRKRRAPTRSYISRGHYSLAMTKNVVDDEADELGKGDERFNPPADGS